MMPGMNPKMMKQAMKRMGISQRELDAKEVRIRLEDKEIVIANPQVAVVNMGDQESYQITGDAVEQSLDTKAEINEEDVQTVMEQANVDEETAKKAIEAAEGDLAAAIMNLSEE